MTINQTASLLDWQVFVGGQQEFYCSPDYCRVPNNWSVQFPVLLILPEHPLNISLVYRGNIVDATQLVAEYIAAECHVNAFLNGQSIDWPTDEPWRNVTFQISTSRLKLDLLVNHCTLALSNLWVGAAHQESYSSSLAESNHAPSKMTFNIALLIACLVTAGMIAAVGMILVLLKRRHRYSVV